MLTTLIGSHGLVATPTTIRSNTRSLSAVMKDKKGWPNFKETQVEAFEEGTDFLFFQSPKPLTGYQPDLPSFFSFDNFADLAISPAQIAVTLTGLGSAGILVASLLSSGELSLDLPVSADGADAAPAAAKMSDEEKAAAAAAKAAAAAEKAAAAAAEKAAVVAKTPVPLMRRVWPAGIPAMHTAEIMNRLNEADPTMVKGPM